MFIIVYTEVLPCPRAVQKDAYMGKGEAPPPPPGGLSGMLVPDEKLFRANGMPKISNSMFLLPACGSHRQPGWGMAVELPAGTTGSNQLLQSCRGALQDSVVANVAGHRHQGSAARDEWQA